MVKQLLVGLLMGMLCVPAFAQNIKVDNAKYVVLVNETVRLEDGHKAVGDFVIPDKVLHKKKNEHVVSIIGPGAFLLSEITSVKIPNTVRRIDEEAFRGCSSLKSVSLSDSILEIPTDCFQFCEALDSIDLKRVQLINRGAFRSSGLKSLTLPSSVRTIGHYAFKNCDKLTDVIISPATDPLVIRPTAFENTQIERMTISRPIEFAEVDSEDSNTTQPKTSLPSVKSLTVSGDIISELPLNILAYFPNLNDLNIIGEPSMNYGSILFLSSIPKNVAFTLDGRSIASESLPQLKLDIKNGIIANTTDYLKGLLEPYLDDIKHSASESNQYKLSNSIDAIGQLIDIYSFTTNKQHQTSYNTPQTDSDNKKFSEFKSNVAYLKSQNRIDDVTDPIWTVYLDTLATTINRLNTEGVKTKSKSQTLWALAVYLFSGMQGTIPEMMHIDEWAENNYLSQDVNNPKQAEYYTAILNAANNTITFDSNGKTTSTRISEDDGDGVAYKMFMKIACLLALNKNKEAATNYTTLRNFYAKFIPMGVEYPEVLNYFSDVLKSRGYQVSGKPQISKSSKSDTDWVEGASRALFDSLLENSGKKKNNKMKGWTDETKAIRKSMKRHR